ncbi:MULTISPECIES: hypothetical protein [unclassified Microbacterium]|uniref:hypothetical protein n=1 Tax=unclassified Microbacterium TaxID=2609290 RepID=UPI003017DD5C
MSTNIYPYEHAAKVAAQRARGQQLAAAVETFRETWHQADAQGRAGSRVKAGLRAVLLPVLVERDTLREERDAALAKLAQVDQLATEHEQLARAYTTYGAHSLAASHQSAARYLRRAIA